MNYKQSVYTIQLKNLKDNFEYTVNSFSGEREENKGNIKIKVCKSLFNDIKLNLSTDYLKELKKFLSSLKRELQNKGIDMSIFMNLHNEKVLINNEIDDNRSYGFLRLLFRDKYNNTYIKDIPILSCNPVNLYGEINFEIQKVINFTNGLKERNMKKFKSIPHVLSAKAASYFIHEIVGHTLEGDIYSYYKNKYNKMKIPEKLTVIDSVNNYEELIGIRKYDDLGIKIEPLVLIKQGKIQNILTMDINDSFDNKLYGVARRESYKFDALPRMRGTYIQPYDDMDKQDILNQYEKAIFLDEVFSGAVNHQTGNYSLNGNGFIVINGKLQEFVGNLRVSGNILKDISNIDYIGKDFNMFGNYCTKFGQTIRVGSGGPTISIASLSSGGVLYERR
ncbi:TldD family protein [Clostridium perfringens]|nr:TldD family protein [Clostridium perfringens]